MYKFVVCTVLIVLLPFVQQTNERPAPSLKEEVKVVGDSADLTSTLVLTGSVVSNKTDSSLRTVIEKSTVTDQGGAWIQAPGAQVPFEDISKAVCAAQYPTDITDKLTIEQKTDQEITIANFTLCLAVHNSGRLLYSTQQNVYFESKNKQHAAMAEIYYDPEVVPSTATGSLDLLYSLLDAFSSFPDLLKCDAIWLHVFKDSPAARSRPEQIGVVWGGKYKWRQYVTPKPTPPIRSSN